MSFHNLSPSKVSALNKVWSFCVVDPQPFTLFFSKINEI